MTDEHLLPFRKGEIITIKDRDEANLWYVGECDGREGSFPADYVELLPGDTLPASTAAPVGPTAIAANATAAQRRLSLTLRKGVIDEELAKHDQQKNQDGASSVSPPPARELPPLPPARPSGDNHRPVGNDTLRHGTMSLADVNKFA